MRTATEESFRFISGADPTINRDTVWGAADSARVVNNTRLHVGVLDDTDTYYVWAKISDSDLYLFKQEDGGSLGAG